MYHHWLLSYPSRSLNLYLISESVLDCVKTEPEDLTGANTRNRSDQEVTFYFVLKGSLQEIHRSYSWRKTSTCIFNTPNLKPPASITTVLDILKWYLRVLGLLLAVFQHLKRCISCRLPLTDTVKRSDWHKELILKVKWHI